MDGVAIFALALSPAQAKARYDKGMAGHGLLDTTPPDISTVSATPDSLWPPDHKMVPVTVAVSVTDACDPDVAAACEIISVSSNESGTSPEWQITGPLTVNLRAERLVTATGRTCTITVQCMNESGNASTKTVAVTVPHDQGD